MEMDAGLDVVFRSYIFSIVFQKKRESIVFFKKMENFESRDLILLLLPMTPIVQYIIFNNDSLSLVDIFIVLSFFSILVLIFAYLIPWGLSVFAPRRILTYVAYFCYFCHFLHAFFTATIHNPKAHQLFQL
jgi:hypothetical protein